MAHISGVFNERDSCPALDLIRSLGFLNLDTGPWVAGGAVRRVFIKDTEKFGFDADVFFAPESHDGRGYTQKMAETTITLRGDLKNTQPRGKTHTDYNLSGGKVQFIKNRTFENAGLLIDDFDYTVCMAATDGWRWIADERFFEDIRGAKLTVNNGDQRRNSLMRMAKYCLYGFTPRPGVLTHIFGLNDPKFNETINDNGIITQKVSDGY